LFIAGGPARVLFAPYFHGSLVDRHAVGTEIQGRLFPAPIVQVAAFCSLVLLVFLGIGALSEAWSGAMAVWLLAGLTLACLVVGLGWRSGRASSALIEDTIEGAFEARRLTSR
jgi:hypothetical protein